MAFAQDVRQCRTRGFVQHDVRQHKIEATAFKICVFGVLLAEMYCDWQRLRAGVCVAQHGCADVDGLNFAIGKASCPGQNAIADRDKKSKDLADESKKIIESFQKRMTDVLKDLETKKGFDYAVSYSRAGGSPFLYVNDKFDITNDVLAALNAKK